MFSDSKQRTPAAAEALPGRTERMAVPDTHFIHGARLSPPFPDGLERAVFAMGCFWGAEQEFWQLQGVYTTAVGYAGGITPNPTYQEVCGGLTGHTEVVLIVFDPSSIGYGDLLTQFWEGHDPTQGMRQGNGRRQPVSVRHPLRRRSTARVGRDDQTCLRSRVAGSRSRPDHDRDRRRARVLLRRGLSPAVSGQEFTRLLRARWYGRVLPGWAIGVVKNPKVTGRLAKSSHLRHGYGGQASLLLTVAS